MTDIERRVRKVSRALGVEVWITPGDDGKPKMIHCYDTEFLPVRYFMELFQSAPSSHELTISRFHERIYRERSRQKFFDQKGLCAMCGKKMKGTENTECDHIKGRGPNGRSDLLSNLQVLHGEPCHRLKHGVNLRA